ncbi:Uncharacterised protein [Mycobacterium tuberculosis]|nr:Uncharacterised protein [Mycobacterium tuberculosis]COX52519.1 Uncharacterised protein [Mycobacterium tuberculosis]
MIANMRPAPRGKASTAEAIPWAVAGVIVVKTSDPPTYPSGDGLRFPTARYLTRSR